MTWKSWPAKFGGSLSFVGLVSASVFFAVSVSPSLLPRTFLFQGLLSGFSLAIGYGLGVLASWLWQYLELPRPNQLVEKYSKWTSVLSSAAIVTWFLWRITFWQNSIRSLMEMEAVETAYPWRTLVVAVVFGLFLIVGSRVLRWMFAFVAGKLDRFLPRRVAYIASVIIVSFLLLTFVNGFLTRKALDIADASFRTADGMIDHGVEQPGESRATGSADSLVDWETIGRRGKNFIVDGPTKAQLIEFWKPDAVEVKQPLRVYVGVRGSETIKQRAALALDELKRVGGFDRKVLVVATPTGTGWLDSNAVNPLEYLHAGDTAIVSMQYSYLPSWLTILIDPERSRVSARALFLAVYDHWRSLPKKNRPRLYLHGLSLGSLGAEGAADLLMTFEDPVQGAVFSGPPFPSRIWSGISKARNEGTPEWLPQFRDSSAVRFTAQKNFVGQMNKRWGPMRIIYIQYASDPMAWFSTDLLFHKPDWLKGQRGPDVSPYLEWYPIVTFLQIGLDLPVATAVPNGYGHNYSASSYIDAWVAVTEPDNWDEKKASQLKELFSGDK